MQGRKAGSRTTALSVGVLVAAAAIGAALLRPRGAERGPVQVPPTVPVVATSRGTGVAPVAAPAPGSMPATPSAQVGLGGPVGEAAGSRSGPANVPAGPEPTEEEVEEAERVAEGLTKFHRDLEHSPGLPQPPVQVARPSPEPWRADPSRQGPAPVVDAVEPARARSGGGDRVVLRGRHLRVVQVVFGTAPARLLSATGEAVTVEAPALAPGQARIAVTNEDGTWTVVETPFVYLE